MVIGWVCNCKFWTFVYGGCQNSGYLLTGDIKNVGFYIKIRSLRFLKLQSWKGPSADSDSGWP